MQRCLGRSVSRPSRLPGYYEALSDETSGLSTLALWVTILIALFILFIVYVLVSWLEWGLPKKDSYGGPDAM